MNSVFKIVKTTAPGLLRVLGLFVATVLAPAVVTSALGALVLVGAVALAYMITHPIAKL